MLSDCDMPIGMLAAYVRFSKYEQSELFGFWYFQEMGLPSTRDEKLAFFHDLMTERCCQLRLKGSLEQIWEIIEVFGQAGGKVPQYPELLDAVKQHGAIRVTFDDLAEAKGTSLELNTLVKVTEPMESVVAKVKNRRDVVELEIEPGWSLLNVMIGFEGEEAPRTNPEAIGQYDDEEDWQEDSETDFSEEDGTIFPLTDEDLGFVSSTVIDFTSTLIANAGPTPRQLVGLARALYALERLPKISPGVNVDYGISLRQGDESFEEMKYWGVRICEDSFEVSSGGSVYNAEVGSDSISGFKLYVEAGSDGYRECNDYCYEWLDDLEELLNLGAELDVTDDSERDCLDHGEVKV
jgi:hypothetical protein